MRFRILLACLLLSCLLISSSLFAAEWKKEYKVSASPTLQVESNDASIEVRGGAVSAISAVVTTNGWEIGPSGVKITEWQNGDQVYLQVKIPNQHWMVNLGKRSVKVEVAVPQKTRVQATTSDGSVRLDGTKAGAVLKTSDGSIHVSGFDGDLQARTSDGSIDADGRFTALDLQTSDGQIKADIATGSKISGPWNLRTSDGSVHLRVPADIAFELDASTGDGSINSDLTIQSEEKARNRLRGKVNGGGPTLHVHTSDGSIHIGKS